MTYHRHCTVIERLSSSLSKQTNCPSRIVSYWLVSSFFIAIVFLYYLLLAYWDHKLLCHQSQQQVALIGNSSGPSSPFAVPPKRKIIILYWTKYFRTIDFEYGLGRAPFAQCDNRGDADVCLTTMDRGLLNESDAVIFHVRDLKENDLPPPEWRLPHQNFVFFLHESPAHTDLNTLRLPVFKNYFNRTMTYRRDSDVVDLHPYGRIKCIDPSPSCLDFPRLNGPSAVEETSAIPFPMDLKPKNKTVAWLVSNCRTDSQRESLVRNLSLSIPVDIYGFCGNGSRHHCPNGVECHRFLGQNYRFYLSFENSLCPDYITEKLYRPMAHDTVPVVYGGSDYSVYLPAGSYVNARDFDSPQSLAQHLKKLMLDDDLYLSHFRWREKYVVDPVPFDGMCQLCRLLSDTKTEDKTYPDIAEWWHGGNHTCLTPPPSLV